MTRDIPTEIVKEENSDNLCFLCGQVFRVGDNIVDVFGDICHIECLHQHVMTALKDAYELRNDDIEEGDDEQAIIS